MSFHKRIIAYYKANNFPLRMMKDYFRFSSKSEIIFDLIFPFVISCIFMFLFIDKNYTVVDIVCSFTEVNGNVITAISILAGFNFASLGLLASSNSETITKLKNTISEELSSEKRKVSHFDMVLIFFSWAIIIQISTIAFILILILISQLTTALNIVNILIVKSIGIVWCTLVLYSLLITIRNVKNMYYFMKYKPK